MLLGSPSKPIVTLTCLMVPFHLVNYSHKAWSVTTGFSVYIRSLYSSSYAKLILSFLLICIAMLKKESYGITMAFFLYTRKNIALNVIICYIKYEEIRNNKNER